ncbi:nuclear transport factor 2 family protein [Hymenobacter sp. GOD-10R]|uniref:nuclear transport factor 2 family protein n=1 Tax=Hymenobacter sp. GOD-10R TaxID=3093922 RepID=UPI002D788F9D|nr:nuclear transport factor 2 family protein [Hymenobacter sp. GOD-10R]WRQ26927.1 nuclear transport factor 2 family protein [Hymenobacter sp. GOD-10R]
MKLTFILQLNISNTFKLTDMLKTYFIIVLSTASFFCKGQSNPNTEFTIRNLEQLAVKGILEADTNILKQVWAPEFMVTTPRNTIAENREAVFKNQKAGLIDYSSFERIIEKIQINENVAITMGYETFVAKHDIPEAKAGERVKRRFTNVWMNKNGQWLQIARQASLICL